MEQTNRTGIPTTAQRHSRRGRYRIHPGDGGTLWLEIREQDGTGARIDLAPDTAAALADRGHGTTPSPVDDTVNLDDVDPDTSDGGVTIGSVNVDGPVRFFCDGRRISTATAMAAIGNGVVAVITDAVRDRSGDSAKAARR